MDQFTNLPDDVDRLIDLLDERFPERCPDPGDSERSIWIAVGARQVVRMLRSLQQQRDEDR